MKRRTRCATKRRQVWLLRKKRFRALRAIKISAGMWCRCSEMVSCCSTPTYTPLWSSWYSSLSQYRRRRRPMRMWSTCDALRTSAAPFRHQWQTTCQSSVSSRSVYWTKLSNFSAWERYSQRSWLDWRKGASFRSLSLLKTLRPRQASRFLTSLTRCSNTRTGRRAGVRLHRAYKAVSRHRMIAPPTRVRWKRSLTWARSTKRLSQYHTAARSLRFQNKHPRKEVSTLLRTTALCNRSWRFRTEIGWNHHLISKGLSVAAVHPKRYIPRQR